MNLDKLTIAIRPRRDWEAVDLGILMARHWYGLSLKVWLLITWPFFLPVAFLPSPYGDWIFLLVWVVKPLFERPLLMILSQGVFGDTPTLKDVLKATPRLWGMQTLLSLTWRRLSPSRSMDLPVVQLEGLRGHERRLRLDILHRQDSTPAKWLTIVGVHLEGFLFIALLLFFAALIPENIEFSLFEMEWWESQGGLMVSAFFVYLSMALVAPFYVACGFSLYLNRRVKLEGWDLEIAFKRMVQRRGFKDIAALVLVCCCGFGILSTGPVQAQQRDPADVIVEQLTGSPATEKTYTEAEQQELDSRDEFRQDIVTILEQSPFRNTETIKIRKVEEEPDEPDSDVNFGILGDLLQGMGRLLDAFALYFEVILWGLVALLIVYVAMRFKRWQHFFAERGFFSKDRFTPTTLFGMEVTEESLPDDISASASQLWQAGDHRAALALLYRASLTRLLLNGVPLRDGSTEHECLTLVREEADQRRVPAAVVSYFSELTRYWRQLAYGHIAPPADAAQALCQSWNRCWMGGPDASQGEP